MSTEVETKQTAEAREAVRRLGGPTCTMCRKVDADAEPLVYDTVVLCNGCSSRFCAQFLKEWSARQRVETLKRLGVSPCPICNRFDTGYEEDRIFFVTTRDTPWLKKNQALHLVKKGTYFQPQSYACICPSCADDMHEARAHTQGST